MNELQFEHDLIQYLTTGTITAINRNDSLREDPSDYIYRTKLWEHEPKIKTTQQLWSNFKLILEKHNQNTLEHSLSNTEFSQVKKIISDLKTPYEAGQFLYGLNGVSQIEIDL
ncbi:MAG TPA: type I restriction endonuclease subunit R, partial [Tetragenococcus sp.]|nr:type I restriction endonuclease subunit R [Tetragenococcus sp.]